MSFKDDFKHLEIDLKVIRSATNDFGDRPIGTGGFGKVFKGELSLPDGKSTTVAFKRLDRRFGQGDNEFWKEIMMLSHCKHRNLISLQGFCDENGERILMYEYASNGSLDRYLGGTSLTWNQLLKICHGAACGLNYLHDPVKHQRVIHRDVKSANILLDENLTAKVSDFGLSKFGPANQQYSYEFSNVVGTPGYCDPMYWGSGSLSKESDVYSFGVVLFEVICGRLCTEYRNGELKNILVPIWKRCYEENKTDDLICKNLKQQMDVNSCKTFLNIAYRCLHNDRKERPTITEVILELEIALDYQEIYEDVDERAKYEERISIANQAATPISYRSRSELALVLSKGIILKGGDRRISINKNGEYSEMVLRNKCLPSHTHDNDIPDPLEELPLSVQDHNKDLIISLECNFELEASTRFLSAHVTYNINLVFKYAFAYKCACVPFKYKLHTETEYWTSTVAQEGTDGILSTKLYQFTSSQREHNFQFQFLGQDCHPFFHVDSDVRDKRCTLHIIGIEFLPVEYEENENLEGEVKVDMQPSVDNLQAGWEEELAIDYAEVINWSNYNMGWTTNRELYPILRNGFLITNNNVVQWFSVSKHMKKRHMVPATAVLKQGSLRSLFGRKDWIATLPETESRFQLVAEFLKIKDITIDTEIDSQLLSPETEYACYLVYRLPEQHSMASCLVQIEDQTVPYGDRPIDEWYADTNHFVDLLTPTHVPFIGCNVDESSHALRARRIKGHPKLRKDGWMEIQIWDFKFGSTSTNEKVRMHCRLRRCYDENNDRLKFTGLVVQGIEFRPAKVSFMTRYRCNPALTKLQAGV